jgi:hypothetical protein
MPSNRGPARRLAAARRGGTVGGASHPAAFESMVARHAIAATRPEAGRARGNRRNIGLTAPGGTGHACTVSGLLPGSLLGSLSKLRGTNTYPQSGEEPEQPPLGGGEGLAPDVRLRAFPGATYRMGRDGRGERRETAWTSLLGCDPMGTTDFLFPMPSFSRGVGTAFDLVGLLDQYNMSPGPQEADALAIHMDWRVIGTDLAKAIDAVAKEIAV